MAVAIPLNADRQSRAVPAARMMVSASTASTVQARNTAANNANPVTGRITFRAQEPELRTLI